MLRRHLLALAGTVALLAPAHAVRAQDPGFPGLTLTFIDPVGTGNATDAFDVWVRLALAADADPLTFDGNSAPDYGMPAGFIPTAGLIGGALPLHPFDSYGQGHTNTAYLCTGTFRNGCSAGVYEFAFHLDDSDPARPMFGFRDGFTLQPGETLEYLFGTFTPVGGSAPAGTYRFYGAYATLNIHGTNADGDDITAYVDLARTCPTNDDACAFTRTIGAAATVPEPATVALLVTGLVGVAGIARRRTT